MGGLHGGAIKAGDRLPIGSRKRGRTPFRGAIARKGVRPLLGSDSAATVRVMAGPHHERLGAGALGLLQAAPYVVGHNSDRMGFRLEGLPIVSAVSTRTVGNPDFISDATPLGSIQVPASGQPIVLMADRQTTGGYPTIATVITADIGVVGQLGPGDSVSFVVTSLREAMAALGERDRALRAIEAQGPA